MKVARDLLTPEQRKRTFETCGKLARLLRSRFRRRAVVDEYEEEVACRLLDWQLSQFRSALKVLLLITAMPQAAAFCKVVLGLDSRWMTPAQDVLLATTYTALLAADWCPWLVTKRTLSLWYFGLMAILALVVIPPLCAGDHLTRAVSIARMVGALLSLARMNLPEVALWSGVHTACECWGRAAQGQIMDDYLWLFWPCMLIMLVGRFEAHVEAELRTNLEANVMQDRHSASDALSAMFYDVVVELDHDRCIVAPTPRLAAFLLRSTPAPLDRTPLEDLLPDEEDRLRLRNLLRPADGPAASSFVELAHARMRGGMGTIFQAELFGYRFRGPGGRQRYLVGVCDAGELDRGGVPMAPAGPPPAAVAPLDEMAVVIDQEFRILSHTRDFGHRIMPVAEGTCLLPAVVKAATFTAWVQEAVNWHLADFSEDEEKPSEPPPESLVVTFRPHGRNSPVRTSAVCKLKVEERVPSDRESRGGQFAVELKFSDVERGSRAVERTGGDQDSGSSSSSSSSRSCRGTPSFSPRMPLEGHFAL